MSFLWVSYSFDLYSCAIKTSKKQSSFYLPCLGQHWFEINSTYPCGLADAETNDDELKENG